MVLLGESGVGKSCVVRRFVRGQFDPSSKVTVGAAFMSWSEVVDLGLDVAVAVAVRGVGPVLVTKLLLPAGGRRRPESPEARAPAGAGGA